MKRKIFASIFAISILTTPIFAKQGMSAWSGPGEVANPDYVPRIPKAQRQKQAEQKKEEAAATPAKKEEPKKEEPKKEVKEEPKVEKKAEPKVEQKNDEYSRSVGNLNISKDDFEADKKAIMAMISELDTIMKDKAYKKWLGYVDSESTEYWSKSSTLKKAQARMPIKGLQLKTLEDYFKYVFVPARQKSKITEIRYESATYVKAVEVQEEQDLVYYYFKKNNGKWLVHIPPL
ncbi:MAG: hypothetical protein IJ717_02425 [Treponema sp.]|nr:hypothetical protein [Treponema sp.]